MIIYGILTLLQKIVGLLLTPINLPDSFPAGLDYILAAFFKILQQGVSVLYAWTWGSIVVNMLKIIIAIEAAWLIYCLVMWVIRKFGMS